MYIVISKPKRKSVAAGVVHVMFISNEIRLSNVWQADLHWETLCLFEHWLARAIRVFISHDFHERHGFVLRLSHSSVYSAAAISINC